MLADNSMFGWDKANLFNSTMDIWEERDRQMKLWGDQSRNHPYEWMSILGEEYGELCEAINETCAHNPRHPERGGLAAIRREATQVMAVACAIVEATMVAEKDENVRRMYRLPKEDGLDGVE